MHRELKGNALKSARVISSFFPVCTDASSDYLYHGICFYDLRI